MDRLSISFNGSVIFPSVSTHVSDLLLRIFCSLSRTQPVVNIQVSGIIHDNRLSRYCPAQVMLPHQIILAWSLRAAFAAALYSNSFGVPGISASYDYIIVGGGTAGLTVTARFAENSDVSVAVIEAGGFYQQDNGNGRYRIT